MAVVMADALGAWALGHGGGDPGGRRYLSWGGGVSQTAGLRAGRDCPRLL